MIIAERRWSCLTSGNAGSVVATPRKKFNLQQGDRMEKQEWVWSIDPENKPNTWRIEKETGHQYLINREPWDLENIFYCYVLLPGATETQNIHYLSAHHVFHAMLLCAEDYGRRMSDHKIHVIGTENIISQSNTDLV